MPPKKILFLEKFHKLNFSVGIKKRRSPIGFYYITEAKTPIGVALVQLSPTRVKILYTKLYCISIWDFNEKKANLNKPYLQVGESYEAVTLVFSTTLYCNKIPNL